MVERSYCTECEWSADEAASLSRSERNTAVLEHFATTGHTIDSESVPADDSAVGWAEEWPP